MKVIGVISSPHMQGNTATLVREALKGAAEEGAAITEIFLPNFRIEYCKGCLRCMADGNCPLSHDDFGTLRDLIYDADGIVWGSPTYGGTYNAMMKTLFERFGMFEFFTSCLGGKYMVGIAASNGNGQKKTARELIMPSRGIIQRGYVSGILGVGFRGGKKAADEPDILSKASKLGRKMSRDIKYRKTYLLQNILMRFVNQFFVKPVFKKAIMTHKEDMTAAVYFNLRQRDLI